ATPLARRHGGPAARARRAVHWHLQAAAGHAPGRDAPRHRPRGEHPARDALGKGGDPMSITNTEALTRVIEHREIFHDEMLALMRRIMSGEMSPVMIAEIAMGLRVKKETIGEIAAAATVMREFALRVDVPDKTHLLDIVGTGGDGSHSFNISTASTFVA